MAKNQKTRAPEQEPEFGSLHEGRSAEELQRDLGFDDLTYESCFRELFEDLLDEPFVETQREASNNGGRVTQMGPGRRHGSGKSE